MNTTQIIALAAVVVAAIGVLLTLIAQLQKGSSEKARQLQGQEAAQLARDAAERDRQRTQLAQAKEQREAAAALPFLRAEYLEGPTKERSGYVYRYRVTNTGQQTAGDPGGSLVDAETDEPAMQSDRGSASGTDGLLHPGQSAELLVRASSLDRPMRLQLSWNEGSSTSHAPVPLSEEDAAEGWNRSP